MSDPSLSAHSGSVCEHLPDLLIPSDEAVECASCGKRWVAGLTEWIAEQRARVERTRQLNAAGFEEQYKQGYERCLDELEDWLAPDQSHARTEN